MAHALPATGVGHYLRDAVYGAGDGVVTTFAVIAGATGADLGLEAALILGLANLVADGVSMGAGNYLALKSQLEQQNASVAAERPRRHGLAALLAFLLFGAIPLAALVAPPSAVFTVASLLSAATLFAVGSLRARFIPRSWLRCGTEMLLVGGAAGACAYVVGLAARLVVG